MNVAETLDVAAQLMPDVPAARHGETLWTYGEIAAHARARCGRVAGIPVEPGVTVALVQELTLDFLATLYGLLAGGATVAPLNVRAKSAELAHMIDAVGAAAVVHDDRYADVVGAALEETATSPSCIATSDLPAGPAAGEGLPCVEPQEPELALLLFTSGTTGLPKRVAFRHSSLVRTLLGAAEPPTGVQRGRTIVAVPNHHIAGAITVLASVFSGRAMELMPAFSSSDWLRLAEGTGADHAFVVPTMLRRILDDPTFDTSNLDRLKTLAYGAAPMPPRLIKEALERFPPTTRFVGSYGQTETVGTVCILSPDDHEAARAGEPDALVRLSSIGRAVDGVEVRALSTDDDVPLPAGEAGELAVHWGNPSKPWHRTGDLAWVDADGYVFFGGRQDDTIIRGGENIDPAEVEHALASHPDVADIAVTGIADDTWGQIVAAFVVPRDGTNPDADELTAHVKASLASFKAPSRFVFLTEIPRTATGKTKRRELGDHLPPLLAIEETI